MQDPRHKNEKIPGNSIGEFLANYISLYQDGLKKVPNAALDQALSLIEKTVSKEGTIYVCGNGGSSSIADHLCCDFMKGTHLPGATPVRAHSLSANSAVFTALANDFGYEHSFSAQVEMLCKPGDLLFLISSSGNSPNILRAAEVAKKNGIDVVGFSGFSGGKLREISTVSLYVPVNNYGIVEDAHQSLMHIFAQFILKKRQSN